jgi:hypothetical protein
LRSCGIWWSTPDGWEKPFTNAGHPQYDTKAFRPDEVDVAKALDKYAEFPWVRNKD